MASIYDAWNRCDTHKKNPSKYLNWNNLQIETQVNGCWFNVGNGKTYTVANIRSFCLLLSFDIQMVVWESSWSLFQYSKPCLTSLRHVWCTVSYCNSFGMNHICLTGSSQAKQAAWISNDPTWFSFHGSLDSRIHNVRHLMNIARCMQLPDLQYEMVPVSGTHTLTHARTHTHTHTHTLTLVKVLTSTITLEMPIWLLKHTLAVREVS